MRVFVLGAGASYGRDGSGPITPPLVDDFLGKAEAIGLFDEGRLPDWRKDLEEKSGLSWQQIVDRVPAFERGADGGHLAVLQSFIREQLGISPGGYASQPINIERLMGLIEGELLGVHGLMKLEGDQPSTVPTSADVLQQQLYLAICGTLVETTQGDCDFHWKLAESLDPGDTVISFNYDLLMDRALARRGDWAMNDGYGLSFHRIGKHAGDDADWRDPLETNSKIRLLKLHGSLNWLYPRNATQVGLNIDLHGASTKDAPSVVFCLDDMHTDFWSDHPLYEWWERYSYEEDDYIFDLHALIVPPSITKAYRNFEPLIGHLWAHAAKALIASASEITFIGYSLRPEDLRSIWLFRKAAVERQRLERVYVVDPSEDVLERVRRVFETVQVERPATTLGEFVDSL